MAQTTRISWTSGSPTTEYRLGANIISQSQSGNYSVVRISAQAINRGSSGAFSNYQGTHTAAIDSEGSVSHSGTMPGGVATDAERWDVYKDITISHASDGTKGSVTLRQTISGWFTNVETASFGGFPRIPKPPSRPGTPKATEILPTSVRLTWTKPTSDGGDAIDGYLVRRWDNPEGTGKYTDNFSSSTTLTRVMTGLTPGKEYRFTVYAHNDSSGGYSVSSLAVVVRTLSGLWTKWQGTWQRAIPYLKVAGVWKPVSVFIKDAGIWKRGG